MAARGLLRLTEQVALPEVPIQALPNVASSAKVSSLSNGIKVASFGPLAYGGASVGLFVNASARHQNPQTQGSVNVLKQLLFKGNKSRTSVEQVREFEAVTPSFNVSVTRESLQVTADVLPSNLESYASILADGVVGIRLKGWEIRDGITEAKHERERNNNGLFTLQDALFRTAFRGSGLGRSLFLQSAPSEDAVRQFAADALSADRLTFVGVNVDHDAFASTIEKNFGRLSSKQSSVLSTDAAKYVGGQTELAGNGDTAIAIAFQGAAISSDKVLHFLVLKGLLGGISPCANGTRPGAGAASYLAETVATQSNSWLNNVSAFNFNFSDAGLLGVYGSARSGNGDKLFSTLHSSLASLANNITDQHVARGKANAKAVVLGNDSRHSLLQLVGQQTAYSKKVQSPTELAAAIDAITTQQIKDLAKSVFSSAPTVVAAGDVSRIPRV
eukprot:TRINITY_DN5763_c0_g4_i2.p1 TRINITY_DN5763_c0_g4~~TRINITY_DN5763_c0_g4_i2.p1  ORF type:complete len:469 (+),score=131.55 TRINITY_DN5763_c0_g4_i2:73-1407(+)